MISISAAIALNGAIGLDNKLLWHLPEDLKRLKKITMGKTLIMGRKTFESLPGVLPGRKHIVVSNRELAINHQNVIVEKDLDAVLLRYKNATEEAFVMGGGMIYERALPDCGKLYLTIVKKAFEADTFFPAVDYSFYRLMDRSEEITDLRSGLIYWFEVYERNDFALIESKSCEGK